MWTKRKQRIGYCHNIGVIRAAQSNCWIFTEDCSPRLMKSKVRGWGVHWPGLRNFPIFYTFSERSSCCDHTCITRQLLAAPFQPVQPRRSYEFILHVREIHVLIYITFDQQNRLCWSLWAPKPVSSIYYSTVFPPQREILKGASPSYPDDT